MLRRLMKIALLLMLGIGVLAGFGLLVELCDRDARRINLDHYEAITVGGSYSDAVRAVGEEPVEISSELVGADTVRRVVWRTHGVAVRSIRCTVTNGVVTSKCQDGLRAAR